ncbi:MAG TPA: hypothetical protein VHF26_16900, partial [Trebonia sp.]|nr:hypothetical protein [Trebonia sp.]
MPCPAGESLRLRLLGRFEFSNGDSVLRVRPTGERLLAYLAVREGPVARPETAAALWPDCPDARAASNLRSVLWRLPGRPGGIVSSRAGKLALAPGVAVDVAEISGALARRSAVGDEVSVGLLQQDVLPGWPDSWLVPIRE